MEALRFRQVHLDFHTSGLIPDIGARFSREQFADALRRGHVDSITLFSKCHHGYSYHPTEANEIHPGLSFDLLGEQIEVCRSLGVRAPVYLSAGVDEKEAVRHAEWLLKPSPDAGADFVNRAGYHVLCYNTPYLDLLAAQLDEVMRLYRPCGIFLDISDVRPCWCQSCIASMRAEGLDPCSAADALVWAERVYAAYCRRMEAVVRKYSAETTIFHNAGNIRRGRRDIAAFDTHLELESLPTGGWGYDHFPMSAAYSRTLGKPFLGMTGKFHTTWGEFGGFKHPNALRYETALSLAQGAGCSIGDQLHPSGEMNESTYDLIGAAYAEVEKKEAWCRGAETLADIAVLSVEAFRAGTPRDNPADIGACRILLEGKYLFDLVDREADFSAYKLLVLPDEIRLDEALRARLAAFAARGGRVLLTGESGLWTERDAFALPLGITDGGESEFCPSYCVPRFAAVNGRTAYVMYTPARRITVGEAEVIADRREPYFNRTAAHFSSHQHAPDREGVSPAAAVCGNFAYIAWKVFTDYAQKGELHVKELCTNVIERLIGAEKSLRAGLPDRGVATLTRQKAENRYIAHLLFAHTSVRGKGVEVIEDVVPLYGVPVSVRLPAAPARAYLVGAGGGTEPLAFTWDGKYANAAVGRMEIHAMAVFEMA